jgi:hypothetical protein
MKSTIGYLRVSTREQGRSGLGLRRSAPRSNILEPERDSWSSIDIRISRQEPVRILCCFVRRLPLR